MITEYTANNLNELLDACHNAWQCFGQPWYRGHACADWKLQPTVHRTFSEASEGPMATKFRLRAKLRNSSVPDMRDWGEWLGLMQHHGLPTRLLDWSESVLIAAFFALSVETYSSPAVIWALSPMKLNQMQNKQNGVALLSGQDVLPYLEPVFTAKDTQAKGVMPVYPTEIDMRMLLQQGAFTIHGSTVPLEGFQDADKYLAKIIIPESAKQHLKSCLDLMNIRLKNIYPDLTNLAQDIRTEHLLMEQSQTKGPAPGI